MALDPQPWLVDPALGHELVDIFSGIEHALKAVGFNRDRHGRLEADWDAFSRAIQGEFEKLQEPQLLEAAKFLVVAPPRQEVKTAQGIGWKSITRPAGLSDMEWLLRMVRQVRNNYFHGGKRSPNAPLEPGRDQKLVESSLTVLRACISLNAKVSAAYEAIAF